MQRLLFTTLMAVLFHTAHAQLIIKPGDATVRYDFIKPVRNLYKYTFVDSAGKAEAPLLGEDIILVNPGDHRFTRIQNILMGKSGILVDSIVCNLSTLAPLRMSTHFLPGTDSMLFLYNGNTIAALISRKGSQNRFENTVTDGYFDSNLQSYLVGLLDYRRLSHCIVNIYNFETKGNDTCVVDLLQEDIFIQNNTVKQAYVIKASNLASGLTSFCWVDKYDGTLLKQRMQLKGGCYIMEKI